MQTEFTAKENIPYPYQEMSHSYFNFVSLFV